ncbi:hypothetical protein [Estrella lausannensis]|nr:hypothetical protein [Estrella lausannensis]
MLPFKLRFLSIIQLCIGFTLLLWMLLSPTLGKTYDDKKKLLLIESALGDTQGAAFKLANDKEKQILERNQILSLSLTSDEKETLTALKRALVERQEQRTLGTLFHETATAFFANPYTLLYVLFSITVPLMILLRKQAAAGALLFLPLTAALFAYDNLLFSPVKQKTEEERLFPEESDLKETFLEVMGGESTSFSLPLALDLWMIQKHLNVAPSSDPEIFSLQKEEANYRFLTLRALSQKNYLLSVKPVERMDKATLSLYFFWNVFFAVTCYRLIRKKSPVIQMDKTTVP